MPSRAKVKRCAESLQRHFPSVAGHYCFRNQKTFSVQRGACPARQRCFAPGLRLPASASALGAGLASCWPRPQQLLPVSATGGGRRRCPLDKRPQLSYNKIIPTKGGVPMRFLHLSDLHLGKRVCEFSMLDDQRYILEQVLSLLDARPVDGVLLAGDLYDKPVPPAEAVRLLDWFQIGRASCRERVSSPV